MATEDATAGAVTEVRSVQRSAAVFAGQTGGVIEAGPGQHSLRLEDLHPAPHTGLGVALCRLHCLTSAAVQVVIGLPDEVSFQIASFTEYFSLFVAKHGVVAETVLT